MRTFFVMAVLLAACGGKASPRSERLFDPEMSEACLGDEVFAVAAEEDAETSCVRTTDRMGRPDWSFPLAEGDELKRVRALAKERPEEPALGELFGRIISAPERVKCQGSREACERYRRNVACEAEAARAERAGVYVAQKRWREAFYDAAAILRAGPGHYGYERVPKLMKALEPHVGGAVHVCLSAYAWPEDDPKGGHWKPYTGADPPP